MEKIRQKLGSRIHSVRIDRDMTQEQLAEHTDFHPTYIAKIEAGKRLPSLDALIRIARALNVPVAYIVEAIDEPAGSVIDGLIKEVSSLLENCNEKEISLVRDFIKLLKRHRICKKKE